MGTQTSLFRDYPTCIVLTGKCLKPANQMLPPGALESGEARGACCLLRTPGPGDCLAPPLPQPGSGGPLQPLEFGVWVVVSMAMAGPQKGQCTSSLEHEPEVRAIRVTCTGSCRVSNKANDAAWVAEEGYFNSALSLADKGSLPAGEHSFPFQFLLPATAPTSFEGPFGKIVHQVRATIDTPRFSKDHQCSRVFYILSPLNLNSIPDIEKFSYKLVKTGSVVLTASTDLRGYVVGQVLRLQADIENQSGKDTSPVVASLLQKVSYKAKRWIYDVRTIAEVEGASVKAWRRAQWQEQILVPALPQSALPGCSLIHVDYYLQVSMKTPEAIVTLPVFIGNIAVNQAPLSPRPGPGLPPGVPPLSVREKAREEDALSGVPSRALPHPPTQSSSLLLRVFVLLSRGVGHFWNGLLEAGTVVLSPRLNQTP
ncbi:arrestin domain-containing protein 1 [Camelus ferus]|nr:arrestin domain-containing protein 1 [Camelus ferus]